MVTETAAQPDGNTSFLRAARGGHLDKVLEHLKNNVDINTANSNGLNALHLASKDGHIHVVEELIKRNANLDAATKKGNTALHIASLAGQEEVVKLLVQHGASVNVQSQNGFTPLYMAAQENHDSVVKFLLANGANQSLATEDGFTPLAVAMQQGHDKVVAVLLENDTRGKVRLPALHIAAKKDDCKAAALLLQNEHNPDVTSKSGFTPLHISSHYGNEAIANLLLTKGANVNYSAKHNITPLHVAAKWGRSNMVALLLEKGANIESKTRDGLTPLHCAARSGHEQVVDMLLERGAPISSKTKNGLSPLHMSAQGDFVDAARILLYHRAPVDDVTVDYLTALHVAAHCGNVRVAKLLLDRKADPNARALNGFTPLHIACKKNHIKVVELLLKSGASIEVTTESGLTPLHVASFMGAMNIVIFLLQSGASPDIPTVRGETPLHLAARANQTDIIRILLRNNAQVDARAREQQTPLHIASRLGNVDIVMLLLQHGAQVDSTTKDLYSALHIAAKEGQDEVASILLENGASLNSTTKKGFTPSHLAAKYGHMKVASLLLQRDAPVDAQGKNGVTPLHVASHYDHQNVALLLLDKGASPHATAKNGHTPIHIAARKNQMDIATTLLEYGAKADVESKAGFTPLHLSAQEGHTDLSSLLIDHHADPNHKAKNGLTPLHLCAQEDRVSVASVLIKNGAEVNATTKAGFTPLHVASHFGQLNMVRLLLANGANPNTTTNLGYSPLHQAAQQGHSTIVAILLDNGASPNTINHQGQTALSIAKKLGYISVVEVLKKVTEAQDSPIQISMTDEKYKVVSPETMQETFLSDSEDEGGEDTILNEQPYRYLTVDEMKSLGDDSLPIDVTRDERFDSNLMMAPPTAMDDSISPQHSYSQMSVPLDNIDIGKHPINIGKLHWRNFLVSFLVDARGGAMRGCRHSGVRVIVPPRCASMPTRVTCRYLRRDKLPHPPPLMEGEALASRILELGPVGAKFLGPVMLEVPHFGSLRGSEREIVILRSDNGETWREHTIDNCEEIIQEVLSHSFEKEEQPQQDDTTRLTRIVTTEFPHYFAVVSRIRQEVHAIGPEGGMVSSSVVSQVQAVFPEGALTKKIKVGLQSQPIPAELVSKLLGNRVAVSPIVTVEPRRRKFHKPITLTIPVPQAASKGMINQYSGDAPTLRLLCSITGGTTRAQWEDVTGSTPLTFVNDCVSFTTTVSARFWLMDCRNVGDATKMATELYREAIHVPFMAKFVVFVKRIDVLEARLRIFCMTDDKEDKTLEHQEHFTEVAKSRDVEVLEGKAQYIEFAGNLVPVTKSGDQLKLGFRAFRENRLPFMVKVKDPHADVVGRILFMREPKVAKGEPPQHPACVLNIVLPENIIPETGLSVSAEELNKYSYLHVSNDASRPDLRLADISNLLAEDWVPLATELGLSNSEINSIKTDFHGSNARQALTMLRYWFQQRGDKASASELESSLMHIGRDDIVEQCIMKQQESDKTNLKSSQIILNADYATVKKSKDPILEVDDHDEKKYIAEEKAVSEGVEEEEVKKSVQERKEEIEKRLSLSKNIDLIMDQKPSDKRKSLVTSDSQSSDKQDEEKRKSLVFSDSQVSDKQEKEIAEEKSVGLDHTFADEPAKLSFEQKRLSFERGSSVERKKSEEKPIESHKASVEKSISIERKRSEEKPVESPKGSFEKGISEDKPSKSPKESFEKVVSIEKKISEDEPAKSPKEPFEKNISIEILEEKLAKSPKESFEKVVSIEKKISGDKSAKSPKESFEKNISIEVSEEQLAKSPKGSFEKVVSIERRISDEKPSDGLTRSISREEAKSESAISGTAKFDSSKIIEEERHVAVPHAEKIVDDSSKIEAGVEEKQLSFQEKRLSFERGLSQTKVLVTSAKGEALESGVEIKEVTHKPTAEEKRRDSALFEGVSQGLVKLDSEIDKPLQPTQDLLSPKIVKTPPPSPAEFKDVVWSGSSQSSQEGKSINGTESAAQEAAEKSVEILSSPSELKESEKSHGVTQAAVKYENVTSSSIIPSPIPRSKLQLESNTFPAKSENPIKEDEPPSQEKNSYSVQTTKNFWEKMSSSSTSSEDMAKTDLSSKLEESQEASKPIAKQRTKSLSSSVSAEENTKSSESDLINAADRKYGLERDDKLNKILQSSTSVLSTDTSVDLLISSSECQEELRNVKSVDSESEYIGSHPSEYFAYENPALKIDSSDFKKRFLPFEERESGIFDKRYSECLNEIPPISLPRKTIYERSVSLPTSELSNSADDGVRTHKRLFESQLKKEMVVDQLMTQLEEESSLEYKTISNFETNLTGVSQKDMIDRQIHSDIFSSEMNEQIDAEMPEHKHISLEGLELDEDHSSQKTDVEQNSSSLKIVSSEVVNEIISKSVSKMSDWGDSYKGSSDSCNKFDETCSPFCKDGPSSHIDSMEVHVDKSELESTEKEIDQTFETPSVKSSELDIGKDFVPEITYSLSEKKCSDSLSMDESVDSLSESDIIPIDVKDKHIGNVLDSVLIAAEISKKDRQIVCTPEEHVPDTVWEVPIQENEQEIYDQGMPIEDEDKYEGKTDASQEMLNEGDIRTMAEGVIADIESVLSGKNIDILSSDVAQSKLSEFIETMHESGVDRNVGKELIESVLAKKHRESMRKMFRKDTNTSSVEITDEDLKSFGVDTDLPLQDLKIQSSEALRRISYGDHSSEVFEKVREEFMPYGTSITSDSSLVDNVLVDIKRSDVQVLNIDEVLAAKIVESSRVRSEKAVDIELKSGDEKTVGDKELILHQEKKLSKTDVKNDFFEKTASPITRTCEPKIECYPQNTSSPTSYNMEYETGNFAGTEGATFRRDSSTITPKNEPKMTIETHEDTDSIGDKVEVYQAVGSKFNDDDHIEDSEHGLSHSFFQNQKRVSDQIQFQRKEEEGSESGAFIIDTSESCEENTKNSSDLVDEGTDVSLRGALGIGNSGIPCQESTKSDAQARKRSKESSKTTNRRSGTDFDTYSSSSESHYQSFEQTDTKTPSRPLSSDVEALLTGAAGTAGSSDYESAISREISSKSNAGTSSHDYHTAVSSLSSRESMKSLSSESSGNLASVEISSEASETLIASTLELDREFDVLSGTTIDEEDFKAQQVFEPYDTEIPSHVICGEASPFKTRKQDTYDDECEGDVIFHPGKSQKMKRSHEMTFQPEPCSVAPDESNPDAAMRVSALVSSMDDPGSSFASSSSDLVSSKPTVIEMHHTDAEKKSITATLSEQWSLNISGSSDQFSFSSESKEESLTAPAAVGTVTNDAVEPIECSTVTILSSVVNENGIGSVGTQVTSENSESFKQGTINTTCQGGRSSLHREEDVDSDVGRKSGHRRTDSTSISSSRIPVLIKKDQVSHKLTETHEDVAESDKYSELDTKCVSLISHHEVEDKEEEYYHTEADQGFYRDVREGKINIDDCFALDEELRDANSRPNSQISKCDSESGQRLPSSTFSDDRPDSELADLLKQGSSDGAFDDPIERPGSPEPPEEIERPSAPEPTDELLTRRRNLSSNCCDDDDASESLANISYDSGFDKDRVFEYSHSPELESCMNIARDKVPFQHNGDHEEELAEAEAAFHVVPRLIPTVSTALPPTIPEDPAAESDELEERETFLKKAALTKAAQQSVGSIPDITVTQHMAPLVDKDFNYPDLENEIANKEDSAVISVSSKTSSETTETDQGQEYVINDDETSCTTGEISATTEEKTAVETKKSCRTEKSDVEKQSATESPTSDSFELIEKPDLIDDFVVVEEVAKEVNEQDLEGKSVSIHKRVVGKVLDSKRNDDQAETEEELIQAEPTTIAKMTSIAYYGPGGVPDDNFSFPLDESPTSKASPDSDFKNDLEDGKKWIEMQFQGESEALSEYGFEAEYSHAPLEDIKEEDMNDMESNKVGSAGSQISQSLGSLGSDKKSLSSTPEYDVLAGKKYFSKSSEHDNISVSSLQEFEKLEQLMAVEALKKSQGSQDSLNTWSSGSKKPHHSYDNISFSSLKEYEGLEIACIEAEIVQKKAKDEEVLLSQIEEGHESQASESESCETISAMKGNDSNSDDYEQRMFEIDEIIRQAQANVEQFVEKTESMGRGDSLEEVARVPELELDRPLISPISSHQEIYSGKKFIQQWPDAEDEMVISTDSLEFKPSNVKHKTSIQITSSTDSLEFKSDVMSASTDSIEFQSKQKRLKQNLMTDSLELESKARDKFFSDSVEENLVRDMDNEDFRYGDKTKIFEPTVSAVICKNDLMGSSTDSLEPSSSAATHATYHYENESMMSSSAGSNTLMSSAENLENCARAGIWFEDAKPYVTEVIEPIEGDEEGYTHTIHRTVEMPPQIHKVTFRGPNAEKALQDYIAKFDPGEDVSETQEVDLDGQMHIKRVVQRRVVLKPEDLETETNIEFDGNAKPFFETKTESISDFERKSSDDLSDLTSSIKSSLEFHQVSSHHHPSLPTLETCGLTNTPHSDRDELSQEKTLDTSKDKKEEASSNASASLSESSLKTGQTSEGIS